MNTKSKIILLLLQNIGSGCCLASDWTANASSRQPVVHALLYPQIFKGDPRTCAIFIPAWGSSWGYLGFSRYQHNCDSSGAYILRSERADKHVWNAARCMKMVDAFCLHLLPRVWSAKTRIPPIWAPWLMAPLHRVIYEVWDLLSISAISLVHLRSYFTEAHVWKFVILIAIWEILLWMRLKL